jgi:lipopolysaccharide export system permease protein
LKKLDRYILKQFLGTFAFTLILILLISVVFDVSEKIDDFYKRSAPLDEILKDYYLNFVIHYGLLFSALFTFIAVIVSTSKLANNTEIIAMLNCGMSLKRLLKPFFIGAALISCLAFYLNNWVLPETNQLRLDFEQEYIRNKKKERHKNIHRQVRPGEYIFLESYNTKKQKGFRFTYEVFEEDQMVSKFKSDFLTWDSLEGKWLAESYNYRELDTLGENIERGAKTHKDFGFFPDELIYQKNSTHLMILPELLEFIEKEKIRGAENIHYYLLDLYQRYTTPLTTFILTLIGFCVAIHKKRGGVGVNLVYGFILATMLILFQKVSITFTTNSDLNPFIAVMLPNIIFGIYAYYMFKKAER